MEPEAPPTFKDIAEHWLRLHVEGQGHRTAAWRRAALTRLAYPAWADKPLKEIGRREVSLLLDKVASERGRPMADGLLSILKSMFSWLEARDESFTSPVVRAMRRDHRPASERSRSRVLTAAEIRSFWWAAEAVGGSGGCLLRLALLTGQRKRLLADMQWSHIDAEGVWRPPVEPRAKGHIGEVRLPTLALQLVHAQRRFIGVPTIHTGTKRVGRLPAPYTSFDFAVRRVQRLMPKGTPSWCPHDLRRTCRTLLEELEVDPIVSESILGHVQGGVVQVYNRFRYTERKSAALQKLAEHVAALVGLEVDEGEREVLLHHGAGLHGQWRAAA